MGRSKPQASMSPIMPTENVGLVSGFMRKPKRQGRRMRPKGSVRIRPSIGQRPLKKGENRLGRDIITLPDFKDEQGNPRKPTPQEFETELAKQGIYKTGKDRPLTGGYNPRSGVRYTDTGVPTAVQGTERVPVQDPTLGGPPEREVPMPRERRQRITRESDPRGGAPFSPDERGMARDRFFERMFDRADERKEQKSMGREERRETSRSMRDERSMRRSEPGEIDINAERSERGGRRGEGGMRKRRRRGGGMRRRGGRRRDFTRKRSRMEGGRRGRSGREMAEFRDQYVSTLR